jgi:hypothetical protein
MTRSDFDDTVLMAYADGALEPDEAARVAAALDTDPEVAARIAKFRETGALLSALGAARPLEPLSDDMARKVDRTLDEAREVGKVVALYPRGTAWRPAVFAASVALVVGAVGGIVATVSLNEPGPAASSLALLGTPGIEDALNRLPAGSRGAVGMGEVEIIASFLTEDGAFCREFEFDRSSGETIVSVACQYNGSWTARFAVATGGPEGAGYAPASALDTLDAFLGSIGARPPLSAEEEAARLSGN